LELGTITILEVKEETFYFMARLNNSRLKVLDLSSQGCFLFNSPLDLKVGFNAFKAGHKLHKSIFDLDFAIDFQFWSIIQFFLGKGSGKT